MIPKVILCPACGSDDTEPTIGNGYVCESCGHTFQVIDGRSHEIEDDDDDPEGR